MKRFKELLATDQVVPLFCLARIPHPVVIEMLSLAGGYQGFWIDCEHGAFSLEQIMVAALAGRANQMDCFVRMPPTGYWQVTQCLEVGAGGIMGAQIRSADHAREFVSWTKFAPQGTRGLNTGGRDADYTFKTAAQFIEDANREHFVAVQIETLGALKDAHAIASIPGVDLLFVGPADLSLALGVPGQFHHERLWEAIGQVSRACHDNGIAWGAVVPDPEFARRAIEQGCRMPTFGNDPTILRRGFETMRSAFGF